MKKMLVGLGIVAAVVAVNQVHLENNSYQWEGQKYGFSGVIVDLTRAAGDNRFCGAGLLTTRGQVRFDLSCGPDL